MLNKLKGSRNSRRKTKCLGRGISSGRGKTCGRGGKGQTARSGVALGGFEGGQMPLYRRLPKRGFKSQNKKRDQIINLCQINSLIKNKKLTTEIKLQDMQKVGLCDINKGAIKLLGKGVFEEKFTIEVSKVSKKFMELALKNGLVIHLLDDKLDEKAAKI